MRQPGKTSERRQFVSKELKEVKEQVLWTFGGQVFQAKGTGSAEALGWKWTYMRSMLSEQDRK